jgi:hypothetical protein
MKTQAQPRTQSQALKLLPIGRAHDLTRMEIEGKHVESAGLRTDFPA